jgi:hypothetical protein
MIVCIERGAAMLVEGGGDLPLFENGEASEYTQNAITFCNEYETERRRTVQFVEMLTTMDLFEVKQAMFTPRLPDGTTGEPQLVAEYFAVSKRSSPSCRPSSSSSFATTARSARSTPT